MILKLNKYINLSSVLIPISKIKEHKGENGLFSILFLLLFEESAIKPFLNHYKTYQTKYLFRCINRFLFHQIEIQNN